MNPESPGGKHIIFFSFNFTRYIIFLYQQSAAYFIYKIISSIPFFFSPFSFYFSFLYIPNYLANTKFSCERTSIVLIRNSNRCCARSMTSAMPRRGNSISLRLCNGAEHSGRRELGRSSAAQEIPIDGYPTDPYGSASIPLKRRDWYVSTYVRTFASLLHFVSKLTRSKLAIELEVQFSEKHWYRLLRIQFNE